MQLIAGFIWVVPREAWRLFTPQPKYKLPVDKTERRFICLKKRETDKPSLSLILEVFTNPITEPFSFTKNTNELFIYLTFEKHQ